MTILPRVFHTRVYSFPENVDDYDIREYDAMTDGSVRGDTNGEIGVWAVGKHRVCEPGRPSIS